MCDNVIRVMPNVSPFVQQTSMIVVGPVDLASGDHDELLLHISIQLEPRVEPHGCVTARTLSPNPPRQFPNMLIPP